MPRAATAPGHRIEVADPALRDDLLAYLESGGWVVEPVGDAELDAVWDPRNPSRADRVNLQFSIAVWRVMNGDVKVSVRFAAGAVESADSAPDEITFTSLSDLAHELRTPLTPILGYLELVLSEEAGELTDAQRSHLEVVARNARRLERLADDVLGLDGGTAPRRRVAA